MLIDEFPRRLCLLGSKELVRQLAPLLVGNLVLHQKLPKVALETLE